MNNNGNYIDQLFVECKKYDQYQSEFENYFASLEYEKAKNLKSFTAQLELIKKLLLEDAGEILKCTYDENNNPKWVDVNKLYYNMYIFLQRQAGIDDQQTHMMTTVSLYKYYNAEKKLDSEKKKFADNMQTIRKELFSNIDVNEKNWFESEDFKKNAFEVIKQFPDFKENLRSDFFEKRSVEPKKPKVDFWALIRLKNFFTCFERLFFQRR